MKDLHFPLSVKGPSKPSVQPATRHDGGDFGILDANGDVLIEVYGRVGAAAYQDAKELALQIKRGLESHEALVALQSLVTEFLDVTYGCSCADGVSDLCWPCRFRLALDAARGAE